MTDESQSESANESKTKRERIIDFAKEGKGNQEIADKVDTTPQYVSQVKSEANLTEVKEEVSEIKEKLESFAEKDETPLPEDDEYWCSYCMEENDEKVQISYMQEECPNGHDLSGDW